MAEANGAKNLSDLSGLSESELLSIPEENLPAALLPDILQRREEALHKKQAEEAGGYDARLASQNREKEQSRTEDQQRVEMETYQSEMRDIYQRENALLEELDVEERKDKKRLAEIDSRALKLSGGRLAYVGANGTYVDQNGQVLRGNDEAEAKAQKLLHPDAATWAEHSAAETQLDEAKQMRREIENMRAQEQQEDRNGVSAEQMASNVSTRGAAVSRYETEFAEEFQSKSAAVQETGKSITNSTFGGDDYMAAYGQQGASLVSSFAAAADGSAASGSNPKSKRQPQKAPAPAHTREGS